MKNVANPATVNIRGEIMLEPAVLPSFTAKVNIHETAYRTKIHPPRACSPRCIRSVSLNQPESQMLTALLGGEMFVERNPSTSIRLFDTTTTVTTTMAPERNWFVIKLPTTGISI
jgi:hypothetical protein